jgi:hypothetical protein
MKMQQKQLMILVLLLVVIVIAIVAVVLLMKPGGGSGGPGGILPATGSVICDLSATGSVEGTPITMTGTTKIKQPRKMRADMSMNAAGMNVQITVIMNGNMMYMYNPMAGGWVQGDISKSQEAANMAGAEWNKIEGKSPQEVEAYFRQSASSNQMMQGVTPTYSCRAGGDVPDSEFQLPPGVTATDISDTLASAGEYGGVGIGP